MSARGNPAFLGYDAPMRVIRHQFFPFFLFLLPLFGLGAIFFAPETAIGDPVAPPEPINALLPGLHGDAPKTGKAIVADLSAMTLTLYLDGAATETLPILSKGRKGTPWETPIGTYGVILKEKNHFSSIGHVYMPWSMQFFGNFFIHGWPYDIAGTDVPEGYSGGCIRLSTPDAERVYRFADRGTSVIVRAEDLPPSAASSAARFIPPASSPELSAKAYIAMDLDRAEVFAQKQEIAAYPDMTTTKFLAALASLEAMNQYEFRALPASPESAHHLPWMDAFGSLPAKDLIVPMLYARSPEIEGFLASQHGKSNYLRLMNAKAVALGMHDTEIHDIGIASSSNTTSAEDMMRLLYAIDRSTSYLLSVTATSVFSLPFPGGDAAPFLNDHAVSVSGAEFLGGLGDPAHGSLVMVFALPLADGTVHRVGIGILGSTDLSGDVPRLLAHLSGMAYRIPEAEPLPEILSLPFSERIRAFLDRTLVPNSLLEEGG